MKSLYHLFYQFIILLIFVTIIDCKRIAIEDSLGKVNKTTGSDSSNNEIATADIIGNWSNILNSVDVLKFFDDSTFNRWDFSSGDFLHFYKYHIKTDSIIIHYYGFYKVGTPLYNRKIMLSKSKDTLTIQDFGSVYPCYRGNLFVKITK